MKRIISCLTVLLLSFCLLFVSCKKEHTHEWGEWVTTRESTCTVAGEKRRECSCGASGTEALPLEPHDYSLGVCKVCGAEKPSDGKHDPSLPYDFDT